MDLGISNVCVFNLLLLVRLVEKDKEIIGLWICSVECNLSLLCLFGCCSREGNEKKLNGEMLDNS